MLHVNRIYTQHYGFGNRLAIAHMPHLIDRNVFREFKAKFSQQWEETSSHKIRQSNDMQFVSIACLLPLVYLILDKISLNSKKKLATMTVFHLFRHSHTFIFL